MSYGSHFTGPTKKQLKKLKDLGYGGPPPKTNKEASILIEKRIPPTPKNLGILKKLNYSGPTPKTEYEATVLIEQLKPPSENQLKIIKELGGRKKPQSYSEASKLISSSSPVTKKQQIYLDL